MPPRRERSRPLNAMQQMKPHPGMDRWVGRWVKASTLGWLLGLVALISMALASDFIRSGREDVYQFMVGVGIGWGVGFAQSRLLRGWLSRPAWWTVASTAGMGSPFIVHDIVTAAGVTISYSLPANVLAGAILAGLWQAVLLKRISARAGWWVLVSVLGWGAPVALTALRDTGFAGFAGDLVSIMAIILGGGILGVVTGPFLVAILRGAALAE